MLRKGRRSKAPGCAGIPTARSSKNPQAERHPGAERMELKRSRFCIRRLPSASSTVSCAALIRQEFRSAARIFDCPRYILFRATHVHGTYFVQSGAGSAFHEFRRKPWQPRQCIRARPTIKRLYAVSFPTVIDSAGYDLHNCRRLQRDICRGPWLRKSPCDCWLVPSIP